MQRRTFIKKSSAIGLITLINPSDVLSAANKNESSELEQGFRKPPFSIHPQTYWFWMNGNVTKEGITLDLEAMKRAGISGVFNFDSGMSIPKGPVEYLSPEWLDLKAHAINEAYRLGIEFTLHNCPGWSSSGGPWITPDLAMQQVTWSEAYIDGEKQVSISLPEPFKKLDYYKDIAVLAYPSLVGELPMQTMLVNSSNGPVSIKSLSGEDPLGVNIYPDNEGEVAWIEFEFQQPFEVKSLTFLISAFDNSHDGTDQHFNSPRTNVLLECSEDKETYYNIATISTGLEAELRTGKKFITYDIPTTKAKYFRLSSAEPRRYSQVRFSGITRLEKFMEKTGNRFMFSGEGVSNVLTGEYQIVPKDSIIDYNDIIDLTSFINKEGVLQWNAPSGNWTILRFGYTPIGAINKAAPETGTGLECDKFNKYAIDLHFTKMMERLLPFLKPLVTKGKVGLDIDSYEAGPQTWTPLFPQEFVKYRGYNIIRYLPALTGRIVNNVDHTERLLWDYRRTQADLIADNYYGRFCELCHQHGFIANIEPYDKGPFEEMQIGSRVDKNLGEFWNGLFSILQGNKPIKRTPKLAASIAHINGQKIVGAESYTSEPESSRWQEYPFALKALGDKMFTKGINKMIFHRFAHQPHPTAAPGMTAGPWGIQFDRTNTWFEQGKEWLTYLARCQYLLQQGFFVADLLYFTGEESNIYTRVNPNELTPMPPKGYDYDLINAEVIIKDVQINNGSIVLPDGMTYRALILQNYKAITLKLLEKLRSLIEQGMILIGAKPLRSLGLDEYSDDDRRFNKLANELWGESDETSLVDRRLGKGYIIWGQEILGILDRHGIDPDFEYTSHSGDSPVNYIHRIIGKDDIYFLANERRTDEELVCTFRVKDKLPEIWDAVKGTIMPSTCYEIIDGRIRMPVQLKPYGSLFIVFRSNASIQRLQHILKDGQPILSTYNFPAAQRKLYKEVSSDFTITLWAKPEINVMTEPSVHMGNVKEPWTEFYAIFPPAGKNLYGEGHATCGLAIGRNGVVVWENESGAPYQVLVASVPISGWSHIALVYKNGTPSVYLNGIFIMDGKTRERIVHPGLGEAYLDEGASYYNGDMSKPQLFKEALDKNVLKRLASESPSKYSSSPVIVEWASDKRINGLLIAQNGKYQLKYSTGHTSAFTISDINQPIELKGPWQLYFPEGFGVPPHIQLEELNSLHKYSDKQVRYFSGTVRYTIDFTVSKEQIAKGKHLFIDLGRVEVIAHVWLNNKDLGILWTRPYKMDITNAVKTGINKLTIEVTNQWVNGLIGDEQIPAPYEFTLTGNSGLEQLAGTNYENQVGLPIRQLPDWYIQGKPKPSDGRVAFTTWKHFHKSDPLLESGLIGPVTIHTTVFKAI